ncbi:radical SAM protein [Candidatus Woesearchaeota archaeon]|nr:radical SAM protein [Candidatus Woesearchaeota archaeon]
MDITFKAGTKGYFNELMLAQGIWKSKIKILQVVITEQCGMSCTHCNNKLGQGNEMSVAKAKQVFDHATDLGARYVSLTGGEPLEHPNIIEIVNYGYRAGLEIVINTNGQKLDLDIAEFLACNGLIRANISYHNQRNWPELLEIMRRMRNPRRAKNGRIPRILPFVNYLLEAGHAEEAVEVARSTIASGAFFNLHLPTYNNGQFSSNDEARPDREDIEKTVRGLASLGRIANFFSIVKEYGESPNLADNYERGFHCDPNGNKFVTIGPEGRMHPCQEWRQTGIEFLSVKSIDSIASTPEFQQNIADARRQCKGCFYNCYIYAGNTGLSALTRYAGQIIKSMKII